ncbi:MAG: SpoIIE family protein phosphatase, partial [Bacteroidota bacterium]
LIADSAGCEYMLLEMGNGCWINRRTQQDSISKSVLKYEWNYLAENPLQTKELWEEKKEYEPRVRPWFIAAVNSNYDSLPAWTEPYTFATTKDPGITASVRWNMNDMVHVIAFDLMLTDISKYTTTLHPSINGKAFILTSEGKIIGLPAETRFIFIDSLKSNVLKTAEETGIPEISSVLAESPAFENNEPFRFSCRGDHWWAELKKYYLSPDTYFLIGVAVPEKDFLAELKGTRNTIIIGFALVIILTLVMVYSFQQKRKANLLLAQRNEEIMQQKEEIETQRDEIEAQRDALEEKNEHITQQKEEIESQRDQLEIQNEELMQAKEEIEAQRDEIESQRDEVLCQRDKIAGQNKEITDSIHYAKRIQAAILPTEDLAGKLLPDHFVLFKPKDIVSGDFYWMTGLEGRTIVAVADCTGHGVPGAFMSMLGAAFLNEIVNKEYITHTGVILRRLRKQVVKALQQKGEAGEQKDGMDISLCSIDLENCTAQFSGANNPLYIIRRKDSESIGLDQEMVKITEGEKYMLYEIRPDKMPIAIYEKMDKFSAVDIKLCKDDTLYMFSDGYADQFGGPSGKKFKYKPFKELLLEIRDEAMAEQCKHLEENHSEWISHTDPESGRDYEQVDDICVLGFRIL